MPKKLKTEVKQPGTVLFFDFFTSEIAEKAVNKSLSDSEKGQIEQLYNKVFHVPMVKTCNNCLSDAFFELYNIWKKDYNVFIDLYNCEYRLRGGVFLEMFGNASMGATNKNLTNKLAEAHLKAFPSKSKLFQQLPDNWQSRIA